MLFVATCTDNPGSNALRLETRPAHLAYLNGLGAKVKVAGALSSFNSGRVSFSKRGALRGSTVSFGASGSASFTICARTTPQASARAHALRSAAAIG